jgi:hypothetical protein
LATNGATARPRRLLASEPLTSQETRVALLVARGLPNREVAAAFATAGPTQNWGERVATGSVGPLRVGHHRIMAMDDQPGIECFLLLLLQCL